MAIERSPYEGSFNRTGMACVGYVTGVDEDARLLRVKTYQGLDDLDLYQVKVLQGFWHSEGDESLLLPRRGTHGVVLFIESQPYWLGAYASPLADGTGKSPKMNSLQEGDIHFKTVAGNKVTLRRGGTVEVLSTDFCKTMWTPSKNLIYSNCQNFEVETAGGHIRWNIDDQNDGTTSLRLKAWNTVNPTNTVILDIGTMSDENTETLEGELQPYASEDLILDFRQGSLDEKLDMVVRSFRVSLKTDGSFYLDIGPSKFTMLIDAQTGDVQFETKGNVSGRVMKDVNLTVEGAVTATVTKDVTLNTEASVIANIKKDLTATVTGKASVSADGGATVSSKADITVDAKGAATVKSGGDATLSATGNVTVKGAEISLKGDSKVSVDAPMIALAGGGVGVARIGDTAMGIGNMGIPIISTINKGSVKVTSG